ncbi:hypothetical protein RMS29_027450 (plasmid) [Agrobacterium rosae]|uniref:Uncharacterized protein n=1 Tax=Agrobacterium rosae TaxID=1972867 RepID=A0AAW9FL46_9HYPH|nr:MULTISPECIES: hypothetical protein [Agrobacterium]MDX8321690.1 hypothetical protein [Agrobacterium sp. rho-8.1]MDX8305153.1 hypothetical protein [Agrobacterium rosae]MDX8311436.1 hypothetical protein [Agrobacterium sp. rho-13.3]MDX8316331.1 hypothetical protein [Agrobacterium rosae]MDX8332362.1 hypothetical protein [Agrobacterium rosae]
MKKYPDDPGPQPRYRWRETWPGENHEDYLGWDGDRSFGRIMLETHGTMRRKWRWSISHMDGAKKTILPHNGWVDHPRVAAAKVEQLYERIAALNGLRLNTQRNQNQSGPASSGDTNKPAS